MRQENCKIKTWQQFAGQVRSNGRGLLSRLDRFPDSILVTGCQRSGTTMLSRVITNSAGMVNYWFGKDDELDAALILSGEVERAPGGRYCFQTTYLNECYKEYFDHIGGYKIVWVLRNPVSVIYSLMYNWRRWPLNELFQACGAGLLTGTTAARYQRFGLLGVPKRMKACLSYNGKLSQLFELKRKLPKESILVVEYDELVQNPGIYLRRIYGFLDLAYKDSYSDPIHGRSTGKKSRLSADERKLVEQLCLPVYQEAKELLD